MRTFWISLCCLAAVMAGCDKAPTTPATSAPASEAVPVEPPSAAKPSTPARRVAGALKADLPEGFELPFAFHRLYDNTGKTEAGKPQRRVLVEYLDEDAAAVQAALITALQAKGFSAPTSQVDGDIVHLEFQRADGASVEAKIDPKREKPRAPNAKGMVHLVWNAA